MPALSDPLVVGLLLGYFVYLVILAGWIVLQRRPPLSTLSWLLSLAALPVLGFVIYFLFGPTRIKRQRHRRSRSRHRLEYGALSRLPAELLKDPPPLAVRQSRLAHAVTGLPVSSCHRVELLVDGGSKFEELLRTISRARHHVHLEYYIVQDDHIGNALREALEERARAGVTVRLLMDAVGSVELPRRYIASLRAAGVEVSIFHPMRFVTLKPLLNLRTHRKIAVIDGRIGFTGGINICDNEDERRNKDAFRDLHLRLEGAAVRWLQSVFVEDWSYARGKPLSGDQLFPQAEPGGIAVQILPAGPDMDWETIHRIKTQAINDSTQRVWLVTPYFVPSEAAYMALTNAALRGVDVKLLVPRLSDSRIVRAAGRSYYADLIRAGIEVYEYLPRMLHSKAMIVDDSCAFVGTDNFDSRSFRLNFELSVALYGQPSVDALERVMCEDFADAERIRADRNPPLWERLFESVARLFSPIL